jgi:hypothetical protein
MNILFLEDRGSVSFYLMERLEELNHEIFEAYSINDAKSYWEKEDINCLIVDLNISPEGLTNEEKEETKHGLLTGWIWLNNYVFNVNPEIRKNTIIYSDYLQSLREYVKSTQQLRQLKLIPKRGSTSPTKEVVEAIKLISSRH